MSIMPRVENTWNKGNMISLAAVLITMGGSYMKLHSEITRQSEISQSYIEELKQQREFTQQLEARVRAVEVSQSRIDEKLIAISGTLQEIKITLQRSLER